MASRLHIPGARAGSGALAALLAVAAAGCGGTAPPPEDDLLTQDRERTLGMARERAEAEPEWVPLAPVDSSRAAPASPVEDASDVGSWTPPAGPVPAAADDPRTNQGWAAGYRVQIFASESALKADRVAREARERLGTAVYVKYDPPLYRVRVGDFRARAEAEAARERARSGGWEGAWIVEDTVRMDPAGG
jgi:cell division septation protein DedD